jgi:hypothetical protein
VSSENVDDEETRETEAIQMYGRWSSQVRTFIIAVTVVVALAAGAGTFYVVFVATHYALRLSSMAGGATGTVVIMIGTAIARYVVRVRSPRIIDILAAHYGIEHARIIAIVEEAQKLG